jgi:hypothetical protein
MSRDGISRDTLKELKELAKCGGCWASKPHALEGIVKLL